MDFTRYFLSGKNRNDLETFNIVIKKGFSFLNGEVRKGKVLQYKSPDFFKTSISQDIPVKPATIDELLNELDFIGSYSISQSDLNYIAFPDSGNSTAALMGEIYSKFLNQNLIAFDRSAPVATFIEIQLIEWLRELVGYDYKKLKDIKSLSEVGGMWTTGGHMSNHIAILTALNHKYGNIKEKGINSLPFTPKIVLAGKISHYSFSSAMHHLGLGNENIINISSAEDFTTNTNELDKLLKRHFNKEDIFMVVGVAGNSRTSSIDNFKKLADVCKKYGIWLHADACHGGSLIFSEKLKNRDLKSIEQADSISLDPHKGMFVTYPCSYVLFKKRDALVKFTRYEETVRNGTAWDLGYINPFFGSRGFESLKMWMLIKHMGLQGLSKTVEKRDEMAKYAAKLIKESNFFTLFHDMTFYRLVFVFFPEYLKEVVSSADHESKKKIKERIDFYTHKINKELYEEGSVTLDEFKLHDIANSTNLDQTEDRFCVMSITIGNPLYTKSSLKKSLAILFRRAGIYSKYLENDIAKIMKKGPYKSISIETSYGPAGWN